MITGINESKILAKHADVNLSLIVENVTRINIEIKINIGMIVKKKKKKKKKKKNHIHKKDYIWNPATRSCKNAKH